MARATGAFFVTFIAISFFLGDFRSSGPFLFALLVSAVVAVAIAWWLRPESERDVEPGVFDERATRRAVRRGVARTGLVAVVWVGLSFFLLGIASAAWQSRGDRESHFALVAGYGFFVSHPGFSSENGPPGCCSRSLRSIDVTVEARPRTADPLAQLLHLTLKLDLQGRLVGGPLGQNELPPTGIDIAQATTSAALSRLPSSVVATAVVEFRRPLQIADAYRVLVLHGLGTEYTTPDVGIYLQPENVIQRPGPRFSLRAGWPNPNIAQFQAWVKKLRPSDDGVLEDLQAPSVDELRSIAARPRVYGLILDDVKPFRLEAFLGDPAVARVRAGDIGFAAGRPTS